MTALDIKGSHTEQKQYSGVESAVIRDSLRIEASIPVAGVRGGGNGKRTRSKARNDQQENKLNEKNVLPGTPCHSRHTRHSVHANHKEKFNFLQTVNLDQTVKQNSIILCDKYSNTV